MKVAIRAVSILMLAAFIGVAAPGRGQTTDDKVIADAWYEDGQKLAKAGRDSEAAKKFDASNKRYPSWSALYNLALCHERLGKTATAWAEFRDVASTLKDRPDRKVPADDASQRATALEPKLTRLKVVIDENSPGLVVTRSGAPLDAAKWGEAVPVDPGKYVIEASAPGKVGWRQEIDVAGEGKTVSVHVPLLASAVVEAPAGRGVSFGVGVAALVLGGAATTVGIATGGLAVSRHATLAKGCEGNICTGASLRSAHDDFVAFGNISTGTLVGAGALLATGVVLVVRSSGSGAAASPSKAWVTPAIGAGTIGVQGRF